MIITPVTCNGTWTPPIQALACRGHLWPVDAIHSAITIKGGPLLAEAKHNLLDYLLIAFILLSIERHVIWQAIPVIMRTSGGLESITQPALNQGLILKYTQGSGLLVHVCMALYWDQNWIKGRLYSINIFLYFIILEMVYNLAINFVTHLKQQEMKWWGNNFISFKYFNVKLFIIFRLHITEWISSIT